jgi:hypothetical protein
MAQTRRTFLKSTSSLTTGLVMSRLKAFAQDKPAFLLPQDFAVKILATNWGFEGSSEAFCKKAKEAGYDGIEVWLPGEENERQEMLDAVKNTICNSVFSPGVAKRFQRTFYVVG